MQQGDLGILESHYVTGGADWDARVHRGCILDSTGVSWEDKM